MRYMPKKNPSLKHDRFRSARGGKTRLLDIHCRGCGCFVATYQKDGPGSLLRMYLDRISSPDHLTGLQHLPLKDVPYLRCPGCGALIGSPYVYTREKRLAFRIRPDGIDKRASK